MHALVGEAFLADLSLQQLCPDNALGDILSGAQQADGLVRRIANNAHLYLEIMQRAIRRVRAMLRRHGFLAGGHRLFNGVTHRL